MLHAAAMLAGLFVLGLLITQGWSSRDEAVLVFVAALASVSAALSLGGVRKNPFSTAPQFLLLIFSRSGAVLHGALSTIRAALAADVRLKPALVRVRSEAIGAAAKAAAADLISAAPGSIVVETDSEGTLVHVMNEDAADSSVFAAVQSRAAALLGARS
jgi:multisubunit Na+/H+ antiporter MnhE subunit